MLDKNDNLNISISTGTMVRFVVVILFVLLLWFLHSLIFVVLTAIVIASFVDSAAPFFNNLKINRVLGIVILYFISLFIIAGIFYLFVPLLITEIYNFSTFLSSSIPGISFLNVFQNEAFSGAKELVNSLSNHFSFSTLLAISKSFIFNLSGGFFATLALAFGSIFNFMLIILISFYLSIQENGIENFLKIIIPIQYEDYAVDLWNRSSKKIGLWIKGQVVLGIVIAVLTYLVLSLLGIEYALLLSLIAGIMELIPYGILVALIPAVTFSYISGGIGSSLMVAGAYLIIHQFEVFLFSPIIIKKVVGLSPIVIILSALIGFELASFWGVALAIPVAIILMEFLNDVEKDKILARTNK